jgi:hypothetical protein
MMHGAPEDRGVSSCIEGIHSEERIASGRATTLLIGRISPAAGVALAWHWRGTVQSARQFASLHGREGFDESALLELQGPKVTLCSPHCKRHCSSAQPRGSPGKQEALSLPCGVGRILGAVCAALQCSLWKVGIAICIVNHV